MTKQNHRWLGINLGVWASAFVVLSAPATQPASLPSLARINKVVGCDFANGRASYEYSAVLGERLYQARLALPAGQEQLQTPCDGIIDQTWQGDVLRVVAVSPGSAVTPAVTVGRQTLLVIFVGFADLPYDPAARKAFESLLPPLADFFERSSRSALSLGWTTLPETLSIPARITDNLPWYQIAAQVNDAFLAAAPQLPGFDHYMFAFPYTYGPQFPFAGLGELGGHRTWINGNWGWGVLAHELGHNFGLEHAHSWVPSTSDPLGPGTDLEYGDNYDLMGNPYLASDYNAAYKDRIGWIRPEAVLQATEPGVVGLSRQKIDATGSVELMTVGYGTSHYFALEYRPELAEVGVSNGVLVRWGMRGGLGQSTTITWLLDMNPLTEGGFLEYPLTPGGVLVDPSQGITLSVLQPEDAARPDSLNVRVDCPSLAPQAQISSPRPGQELMVNEPLVVTFSAQYNSQNIVEAELLADGRVVAVSLSPPFDLTWTPVSLRVTTLTVRTLDRYGQMADSAPVHITVNWRDQPKLWRLPETSLAQLTWGFGSWLAVANGQLCSSSDLLVWQPVTVAPALAGTVRAMAQGPSGVVAVGSEGLIVSSADGSSWVGQTVGSGNWNAVAALGPVWVAAGDSGLIASSPDTVSCRVTTVVAGDDMIGLAASASALIGIGANGHAVDLSSVANLVGVDRQSDLAPGGGRAGPSAAMVVVPSWPSQWLGQGVSCRGITWDGTDFWVLGSASGEGRLYRSRDGHAWFGAKAGSTGDDSLSLLARVSNGVMVGAGEFIDYRLPNGVWRKLQTAPILFQEVVPHGNSVVFLARSVTGTTLASLSLPESFYDRWVASRPPGSNPDLVEYAVGTTGGAGGQLRISMSDPYQAQIWLEGALRPDVRYVIQQSDDLSVWSYAFDLPQSRAPRGPQRLFRLQLERISLW